MKTVCFTLAVLLCVLCAACGGKNYLSYTQEDWMNAGEADRQAAMDAFSKALKAEEKGIVMTADIVDLAFEANPGKTLQQMVDGANTASSETPDISSTPQASPTPTSTLTPEISPTPEASDAPEGSSTPEASPASETTPTAESSPTA